MRIHSRDPGWLATLALGGSALFVAATLIAVRLTVPSERAIVNSATWPWQSAGVVVEAATEDSAFRDGDLVIAMAGRPIETWVRDAIRWPWQTAPVSIGDPVAFDVVRDGQAVHLAVSLAGYPSERLAAAPLGLVAFGGGVLVLAGVLLFRRPRSTALRLLFVGAAANVADIVAWELGLQPTDLAGTTPFLWAFGTAAVFNMIFWSTIVHILAIYPVRSTLALRHRWLVPIFYVAPQIMLIVLFIAAWLAGGSILDRVDRLPAVVAGVASGMLVVIAASTVAGYRRTSPAERRRVRAIAITLILAAIATFLLLTGPIVLAGRPLLPRGIVSFFVLPVPIAIAVAVVRDRLFQVSLLSRSREALVAAREEERRKLRRELHDGLAPTLAAVGLKIDFARSTIRTDPAGAEAALDGIRVDVRAAIADIRRVARELRPPTLDALGLVGAIRQQAETLDSRPDGGPVIIVEAPERLVGLPAGVEVAAYRIVVEALMNVIRHAEASTCEIRIHLGDGELLIDVVDDGAGLPKDAAGVGTRSMRERATEVGGDLRIEPAVPRGTRVSARLPVDMSLLPDPVLG